jgi:hypothetical protein
MGTEASLTYTNITADKYEVDTGLIILHSSRLFGLIGDCEWRNCVHEVAVLLQKFSTWIEGPAKHPSVDSNSFPKIEPCICNVEEPR